MEGGTRTGGAGVCRASEGDTGSLLRGSPALLSWPSRPLRSAGAPERVAGAEGGSLNVLSFRGTWRS